MDVKKNIVGWLLVQENWIQEAAEKIISSQAITEEVIKELVELLKTPAGRAVSNSRKFEGLYSEERNNGELRLLSVGPVEGIDALSPRTPLTFGEKNLTVVYGGNGAGKSGYIRILKKISGKPTAELLKSNIFEAAPVNRRCTLNYSIAGVEKAVTWEVDQPFVKDLNTVDIFDSKCGAVYLDGENDASYIPSSVGLFEGLVSICVRIKSKLEQEQARLTSSLPVYPTDYKNTKMARGISALKAGAAEQALRDFFRYTEDDAKSSVELQERLQTADPVALAKVCRSQKLQIEALVKDINSAAQKISPKACREYFDVYTNAKDKRKIAIDGVQAVTKNAVLGGIGSETWMALWKAAEAYSMNVAYPGIPYPNVGDDAKCVLCHQSLDETAKQRLEDFQGYVKGVLESEAQAAEGAYKLLKAALPLTNDEAQTRTRLQAAGLDEDEWLVKIFTIWNEIKAIREDLMKGERVSAHAGFTFPVDIMNSLLGAMARLEQQAAQLDEDAKMFDREKARLELTEIKAKQWCATQIESIVAEVQRLNSLKTYADLIAATNTRPISLKSGEVSTAVITDAYVQRFNDELTFLGAGHIHVELVKTRVAQGKVKHRVQVKGVWTGKINPSGILSDGEQRIISLAAFLADVTGKSDIAPFIFDDPISSLDQDFEERTAERLIKLSKERQVLIFTHRLSLLGLLMDKSDSHECYLSRESWGAGEPGNTPLFAKSPIKALKALKNDRLSRARKILSEHGSEAYQPLAKAICNEVRILLERIIEVDLLADVIKRHRREVQTLNKLEKLAKITSADCAYLNELMGKFSRYEHSQSAEAPVPIPECAELETDIDGIINWHEQFAVRAIPQ